MKKVKQIDVSQSKKYILWTEDTSSIVYNTKVVVNAGCKAMYYINGAKECDFAPGLHIIYDKKERREIQSLKLICYNADTSVEVKYGVSGIKYRDYEINEETEIGTHGVCTAKIINAAQLYKAIGKDFITENDVNDYIRDKTRLQTILVTELAKMLQSHTYNTIDTKMTELSDTICEQLSSILNDIGLMIEDVKVDEIYFPPEFKNKRDRYFDNENRNRIQDEEFRRKRKEQKAEIEIIKTLTSATDKKDEVSEQKTCPRCNTLNKAKNSFCCNCGLPLNNKNN